MKPHWTHEQLLLAFNLYCKIPFGRIHNRNPEIIELAKIIDRTPSAVSWKLANFASLDPVLKLRNIKGASHASKGDIDIWNEFNKNWDKLSFESENLIIKLSSKRKILESQIEDFNRYQGEDKKSLVKIRVNQNFFRAAVLASYNSTCCITGIDYPELLNASHIIPWKDDKSNRTNPQNGVCLNAFHDRAFDRGLITITTELKVKVSPLLKKRKQSESLVAFLYRFDNQSIQQPERFPPDPVFLKFHNKNIFQQ